MRTKILLGLSLASVLPLMGMQIGSMLRKPHLWFFPLAWIALAIVVYRLPNKGFAANGWRRFIGRAVVVFSSAAALLGALLVSPALTHLATHGLVFGWLLLIFGLCILVSLGCRF